MKKFLHVGLSTGNNGHNIGLNEVFNVGEWQSEDINVAESDLNYKLIELANNYKPDLIFIQIQSSGISKEAIQAFKSNNGFIIQWSGDMRHRTPDCYFEYCQMGVDLTCFSNIVDVENVSKCGYNSCFLQIGADPYTYNKTGTINHLADIVYFANNFGHFPLSSLRRDVVNELKHTYGDNFKAFGSGQPDGSYMGNQPGEAAIYRGAKIGINLSHFDSPRYTSDRMMRMLLSGICVLSHNFQKSNDFDQSVVFWNDINDLKNKINGLLVDESIRQSIADRGYELGMREYTFKKMAENILELYNKYKPQ